MTVDPLRIGFVPLLDCAILAVAREKGFAARHGLALELVREASWAAIRDKVAYGQLDGAHMLAGLPIAATLGIGPPEVGMIAPMALGQGGNAVTVSRALYTRLCAADPEAMAGPRLGTVRALAAVIAADRAAGRPPPAFASVFPFSSHNYELRYWLAAGGIDPDRDVNLGVVAPPRMVDALASGHIDGYCVGEPWNMIARNRDLGAVVVTKADIWPAAPEKVLGLRADWADRHPERLGALIRALVDAARWADVPENRVELAALLSQPMYVGAAPALLRAALCGEAALRPDTPAAPLPHRPVFYAGAATFPWVSQAMWLITQMQRWGQLPASVPVAQAAARVYRPDLYRTALAGTDIPVPAADLKVEGAAYTAYEVATTTGGTLAMPADRIMDGAVFDPA